MTRLLPWIRRNRPHLILSPKWWARFTALGIHWPMRLFGVVFGNTFFGVMQRKALGRDEIERQIKARREDQ